MTVSHRATRYARLAALSAVISLVIAQPTGAQESEAAATTAPATTAPAAVEAVLPIPDYSGDVWERSFLLGDLGGDRTDLAEKGVQFNVDWVQTAQSVVDGGSDTGTKYGGSLDYLLYIDLYRMGLMPGAFIKVRAESRYGESVNDMSGAILPVSTDGFFPLTDSIDEDIAITVTAVTYYQYLSEKFALFGGKLDSLDSDLNEFASGRGNSQFLNTQLVFSPTLALMPYSTIGGGAILMPTKNLTISSLVVSLNDSSTTTGLGDNELEEGWAWASEASFQYRVGKLPGGTNIGAVYLWDTEFFDFSGRFTFAPGEAIVPPTTSDTWIAYVSGWQYLFARDGADGPLNLANGEPDREGFGVFWRAAVADDDVNPTQWSLSGGVGGKGMIPGRARDFFGVGYFYNSVQSSRLTSALGLDDHTQGFECFYNISLTPAAQLTLDAQLIDSADSDLDTGVVLGMRLKIEL
ncbi:MAG: carbohydrate porin [Tepidisphaeraceae bacterium]